MFTIKIQENSNENIIGDDKNTYEVKLFVNGEEVPVLLESICLSSSENFYKSRVTGKARPKYYDNSVTFTSQPIQELEYPND